MNLSAKKNDYLTYESIPMLVASFLIGCSIFWGVASFKHIGPGFFDNYIDLQISVMISVATIIFVFFSKKIIHGSSVSLLTFGWLYFFILVILQPVLNSILYSDTLIFPLGMLSIALILSWIIPNLSNKLLVLKASTLAIFLAALLTVFTLIIQTLELSSLYGWLVMPIGEGGRPIGNVAQPNQAAFIIVLGVIAFFYFRETTFLVDQKIVSYLIFFILSFGLGLTSSRGGLLLIIIAICSYEIFENLTNRDKFKSFLLLSSVFIIGYLFGTVLLELHKENVQNGIERFSGGSIRNRISLLTQAMLIFKDNWLTGAGWGNYSSAGLDYIEQIDWVHFATHSHLIFSHIMAELGLLGLIGTSFFVYVLGKRLISYKKFRVDEEFRLAMSVCICIVAYSFSEFPLWYLKYLIIFVIYSSYLDVPTKINIDIPKTKTVIIVPLLILIGSVFYLKQYTRYAEVTDYILTSNSSDKDKFAKYSELSVPYGFTFYNEIILFNYFTLDSNKLDYKLSVGNRIIHQTPIPPFAIKQAIFLGLKKKPEESLKLFQVACLFNYSNQCDLVVDRLASLEKQLPDYFTDINVKFNLWKEATAIK